MNNPVVSVLIPVYNVEKYLEECLESIISQKYKTLEIILVNDGSTDKSGEICDEYAKKDSRIKVIHQKNQGIATVRNVSVAAATGDYIGFVDSDDFIAPDMYSDMISIAEEKNADIVMCNLGYVDQSGKGIPNYRSAQPISDRELTGRQFVTELCNNYSSTYVVTVDKLYRRSIFDGIRYPDGKINEDEAVIHRIAHKCNKIVFTSKEYYFYRQQSESIMNKSFTYRRLDNTIALIDRVQFITNNGYEAEAIYNCELFLINDFISSIRNLNKKSKSDRDAIKEKFNLVKPYCKKLLKNSRADKDTKKVIRCLLFSPFLFFYI